MAIPETIKNLANKVRHAVYGHEVRESIAKSMEETGSTADEARQITEQLIDGSFDTGLLNTNIEQKLNNLETEYTPKLNQVNAQLAEKANNEIVNTIFYNPTFTDEIVNVLGYTYEQIIAEYETLRSRYSKYMTRTLLGKDTSGTYDMYTYEIKQPKGKAKGTIILGANIHGPDVGGDDKHCGVSLLHFIKDMMDNWSINEKLMYLRHNFDFVIMPVENPWGFNNGKRQNVNGVDVNRNFDNNWSAYPDYGQWHSNYKGTAPFSEKESQYIRDVLIQHKEKALFYYAFHNGFGTADTYGYYFIGSPTSPCTHVAYQVGEYLNIKNGGNLYITDTANSAPTAPLYSWEVLGIPSCNPEYPPRISFLNDYETIKSQVEWYGNLVYRHSVYIGNEILYKPEVEYTNTLLNVDTNNMSTWTVGTATTLFDKWVKKYDELGFFNSTKGAFVIPKDVHTVQISANLRFSYTGSVEKIAAISLQLRKNGYFYEGMPVQTVFAHLSPTLKEVAINLSSHEIRVQEGDEFALYVQQKGAEWELAIDPTIPNMSSFQIRKIK